MTQLKILGLCGSLSKSSLNKKLLLAWQSHLPENVELSLFELHEIPAYNADIESDPISVTDLKGAIAQSHGVAIATPEFNYGIPGVLKNAIDWASRPGYNSVFAHKPVTMFGASPGAVGTARAQGQLKQVLLGILSEVYPCPELAVGMAKTKFDENGHVTDEALSKALARHAQDFCKWVSVRSNDK